MQYRIGNIPFISWMSNHFYVYGGAGFTSMEAKEYNFGSVKPGTLHPHILAWRAYFIRIEKP